MASRASKPLTPEQKMAKIARALKRGGDTHSLQDILDGLLAGKYQLFENDDGVCITEIMEAPKGRYLHCWVVAGRLPGVMQLQDAVERHALTNSCRFMSTSGRFGWKAVLPHYGWKPSQIVFTKELSNGC